MNTGTALALRDIEILYRPFIHRKIELCTRIVMAPMARNYATDGIPTPEMLRYYRRRAEHELGLIITEGASIDAPAAAASADTPSFFGGAALRAWKRICQAVHATNCKIIPQIQHAGLMRPSDGRAPTPEEAAISPSGIHPITLQRVGAPMSHGRIRDVVLSFARAAENARKLGFDGVEINGAYGMLIDQFLRTETNHREDEYGGDLPGRVRFACEVVQAVRKAVGRRFPIFFRLSQGYPGHEEARLANTPEELAEIVRPLSEAGVDVFDCTSLHYGHPEFEGSPMGLAAWVRRLSNRPAICSGAIGLEPGFPSQLLRSLSMNEIDLIAIGRALLADPAWASKVHASMESSITPFTPQHLARLL